MFTSDPEQTQPIGAAPSSTTPFGNFRAIGLNYRSAALRTRNAVSLTEAGMRAVLAELADQGITEALVISTCNRTEVYYFGSEFEPALAALSAQSEVSVAKLDAITYQFEQTEAVRQLFRVTCGLDSAVLGEHEVLGQIKVAHGIARDAGSIGRKLGPLYQRALRASKRVRTESDLCREVTSISNMALRKASALAGGLRDRTVLVIGAGQIAERVAKDLHHAECGRAYICNRTEDKAVRLASIYGLQTWKFADMDRGLEEADIIVCAVSSRTPILDRNRVLNARKGRPVVIVDLGVPPNYNTEDPESCDDGTIRLVEMEAIVKACHAGSQSRIAAVPKATAILEEELTAFEQDLLQREAAPYIKALTSFMEEVRIRNLDWALEQNPALSAKERKLLEDLSIRMVRGMLERPIHTLKTELRDPEEREVAARLFAVEAPASQ